MHPLIFFVVAALNTPGDEDKSPYNEKALAAKEDYKMKVAEYERSKTETVASEESAPVKEEGDSDEEAEEDDVDDDDED